MSSKITIKRSTSATPPAGLSFGEMAFVQGTGLTANQLYVGISGGSPVWVGAQIGTTGSWTDNSAKTSLATQFAIDQRISAQISGSNPITTVNDNSNATRYLVLTSGIGSGVTLGVDVSTGPLSYNPQSGELTLGGNLKISGDIVSGVGKAVGDIFATTTSKLNIGLAASGITMGGTTGSIALRPTQLILGTTSSNITTSGGTANNLYIQPYGSLLLQPQTTAFDTGGTKTSLVVTNTVDGAGQVQIVGGDLALGTKSMGFSSEPVNIVFEGATENANKTTLSVVDPTANRTILLPNESDTLVGKATTDIFTNKTYDTGNTGNVFRIAGATLSAVTGTGSVVLSTSPAITTSLTTPSSSFTLLASPTTVNFAGAATALNMGVLGGTATFAGAVTVAGNLTVNGTTTTINSTTLTVDDKNIEMGAVDTPTVDTADGGGIILKGDSDKSILWDKLNTNFTSNQHWNLPTGKVFKINNVSVLSSSALGSGITGSSLTQVGTITSGTWQGTQITDTYLAQITTASKVANSATTATSANTVSAIVARDASGDFSARIITGNTFSGNASTATTSTNIVATEQTTGTIYLVGVAAASASTGLLVNASPAGALEYNVATGELSATLIDGGSF